MYRRINRSGRVITAAALLTGAALGVAAPAGAAPAPRPSEAHLIGTVQIDADNPEVALVHARYRCSGEGHLWVSVKQTADRSADPRLAQEGSSAIAAAWSDSHREAVTCDGRWHTQKFEVDQVEPYFTREGPQGPKSEAYEPLAKGEGWVQFCLFDDDNVEVPVTAQRFVNVR